MFGSMRVLERCWIACFQAWKSEDRDSHSWRAKSLGSGGRRDSEREDWVVDVERDQGVEGIEDDVLCGELGEWTWWPLGGGIRSVSRSCFRSRSIAMKAARRAMRWLNAS